jgi:hypothetical protein
MLLVRFLLLFLFIYTHLSLLASADMDYGRPYASSVDSHASIPSISPFADPGAGAFEPYPAWSSNRQIPMSTEEIEDIFLDLTQKFGFQRDSMRNMVCSLTSYRSFPLPHYNSVRLHHAPSRFSCFSYDPKPGSYYPSCRLHRWPACKLS